MLFAASDNLDVGDSVGDFVGDALMSQLTERQKNILRLVIESPTLTGSRMSEILSVSQRTIERDLSLLKKLGVLKREGKDNKGTWTIARLV